MSEEEETEKPKMGECLRCMEYKWLVDGTYCKNCREYVDIQLARE